MHKGYRFRAVGNRLCWRSPKETFHEFILNVLKLTLGKEWYFAELAKPSDQQHQVVRWFVELSEWQKRAATEANAVPGGWAAAPSGNVQALLTLAYDIYHLEHVDRLAPDLLRRLKDRNEFQGARYEIAVAGIFARMNYEIGFINDRTTKHCEFIAADTASARKIAVEAKSRRRQGVLHERGAIDTLAAMRGDIDSLFQRALTQGPDDLPFIVFVDLNAPPTPDTPLPDKPWLNDIREMLEAYGAPTPESPDRYTALVLTNFAYHYAGAQDQAPAGEFVLVIGRHSRHPLPMEFFDHLVRALNEYGRVPTDL